MVGTTNQHRSAFAGAASGARRASDTVARHPGRAILLLIDTQGQQLRRHDELLGINRAMAHLGRCVDLARRRGHRVIGLVYDQALSGGFITSGLIADGCYALPEAEIRVMRIPGHGARHQASRRVPDGAVESSPVFAPRSAELRCMGGVRALWSGDLKACLRDALNHDAHRRPTRQRTAHARGGRKMAAIVIEQVLAA